MTYREGTKIPLQKFAIIYSHGGIGDYIQFTQAIIYNLKTYKWLTGEIFVKKFFYELAHHWLTPHLDGRFVITPIDSFKTMRPRIVSYVRGVSGSVGSLNTLNSSIMSVAFHNFADLTYIPDEYNSYPRIDTSAVEISFELPKRYAVLTTMSTSGVRTLKAVTIDSIANYLNDLGVTPVFLGKEELDPEVNYKGKSVEGVDYTKGIDLRNKTTLLEAAAIMNNSQLTLGLDNGLLHLASCTDTNVLWAFNTVRPELRLVRRPSDKGETVVLTPPKDKLNCTFCQSDMKFLLGHDFKTCYYKDVKCLDYLNFNVFKKAIDGLLKDRP